MTISKYEGILHSYLEFLNNYLKKEIEKIVELKKIYWT